MKTRLNILLDYAKVTLLCFVFFTLGFFVFITKIYAQTNMDILILTNNNYSILMALLYLIIVTIWTSSLYFRVIQNSVKKAALLTGLILNSWTLVRLIKYQIITLDILSRYLWYSFYFFQLSIPLTILWMSWSIDKPKDLNKPPKWLTIIAIISGLLFILVFSNDLHGQVFILDLNRTDWAINYAYGIGYYIVLVFAMSNIFLAFLIQVKKSDKRKGFVVPLMIFIMFGFYTYKYIVRDPLFYNSDITIVTGLFTMLMFETCIRFNLIPTNSSYVQLFTQSPIDLNIYNNDKQLVLSSKSNDDYPASLIDKVLIPNAKPLIVSDKLISSSVITGGFAVSFDDISKINEMFYKNLAASEMLEEANSILANQARVDKSLKQVIAKIELKNDFENEISQNIKDLSDMLNILENNLGDKKLLNQIALLLTFIKRKSNLFFLLKKQEETDIKKLKAYVDELESFSTTFNTKIASVYEIDGDIKTIYVLLFYELFYVILNEAIKKGCPIIIFYLEQDINYLKMRLLPSENLGMIKINANLSRAIAINNGKIEKKSVEDSLGISLIFKKGGQGNE